MTDATEQAVGGIWGRLRRRKVVQWGLAYAAGAWVALQVFGFAADAFGWTAITKQLAMLALAIGLPVALVLAWYHGDRGQQRVTRSELAILSLLLIGGAALWVYTKREQSVPAEATAAKPRAQPVIAEERPSIAVLPFDNRSDKPEDAHFVEGIHDDILTRLTKIGAMKVIARTSVEQFRETKLTTREIGEKLGVTRVLEGGVQRSGDRIRVSVQLVDTATEAHLWAESYDRELTAANVFAIQGEVAGAIADALKTTLTGDERARVNVVPTENLEAWEAYHQGRRSTASRASASLVEAERHFQEAIELDPEFALAYAGLADTLLMQVVWLGTPPASTIARAEQLAGKALELAPGSAEAWASWAYVHQMNRDYGRAEDGCRRAIKLNPGFATAHANLSLVLLKEGRPREALAASVTALELDPLSTTTNIFNARALVGLGRLDEAEARYRRVMEIDPARPSTYLELAVLYAYARNRFVDATAFAQKLVKLDPAAPYTWFYLSRLHIDLDDIAEAMRVMDAARRVLSDSVQVSDALAWLYLHMGREAEAVRHAQQAISGDPGQVWLQPTLVLTAIDARRGDYWAARSHFEALQPTLLGLQPPAISMDNFGLILALVPILQRTGDTERAELLLDRVEAFIGDKPRLSVWGYGVADAQVYALRGDRPRALAALRSAERAGWRKDWRYHRDFDPAFSLIRDQAEFQAVFADIAHDMERQRAELAARPQESTLDMAAAH